MERTIGGNKIYEIATTWNTEDIIKYDETLTYNLSQPPQNGVKLTRVYTICGKTKAGVGAATPFFTSLQELAQFFLKEHPRFTGEARIGTHMAEDLGFSSSHHLLLTDRWGLETILLFKSVKELKQYLGEQK